MRIEPSEIMPGCNVASIVGVVDGVIEKSTDGRLAKMIGEAMSTWIANKALDDVWDAITTFVTDEIDIEMSKHEKNEEE